MMYRLAQLEREFPTQAAAERWFSSLRHTAWPYVWCTEIPQTGRWRVQAWIALPQGRATNGNRIPSRHH